MSNAEETPTEMRGKKPAKIDTAPKAETATKKKKTWNFPELKKAVDGGPQRDFLKKREFDLDINSQVGKRTFHQPDEEDSSKKTGFYCKTCDLSFTDSLSWVAHANSRNHQKMMGMSMRTEKAGADAVKEKLKQLRANRDRDDSTKMLDIEMQMAQKLQEREKQERDEKAAKREAKRRRLSGEDEAAAAEDPMMKMMGFSSFK